MNAFDGMYGDHLKTLWAPPTQIPMMPNPGNDPQMGPRTHGERGGNAFARRFLRRQRRDGMMPPGYGGGWGGPPPMVQPYGDSFDFQQPQFQQPNQFNVHYAPPPRLY